MNSWLGRKKSDDELFSRRINEDHMTRISDGWTEKCEAANLKLHKHVYKELDKRVKGSKADGGGKPKLELKNCELTDKQVKILLVILAQHPVMSKLDLSGNSITNKVSRRHSMVMFYTEAPTMFVFELVVGRLGIISNRTSLFSLLVLSPRRPLHT